MNYTRLLILFALALVALFPNFAYASGCGTLPAGVTLQYCQTINIQNTQGAAFAANTQIGIVYPANSYSTYTTANMMNYLVYNTLSGQVAPCWIEGNTLNPTQTSNLGSSSSLLYRCKIPDAIAASTTDSNWAFGIGTTSTNWYNNNNAQIGAAPNLYCASGCPGTTYAGVDNGQNVFLFYENFRSGLAQWTNGGSGSASSGLTITTPGSTGCGASGYIYSNPTVYGAGNTLDTLANIGSSGGSWGAIGSGLVSSPNGCGGTAGENWWLSNGGSTFNTGGPGGSTSWTGQRGQYEVFSVGSNFAGSTTYWIEFPYMAFTSGYSSAGLGTVSGSLNVNPYTQTNAGSSFLAYWTAVRQTPPNGVEPTVTFSNPTTPSQVTISFSPSNAITYGTASVSVTATCSPGTDTCAIQAPLATNLCTGTGTCTYTIPNYPAAGTYTYYANDLTLNNNIAGTLTVNQASCPVTLPSFPSPNSMVYNGQTQTITGSISTLYNQLTANLIINGIVINSAYSTTNTVTEVLAGTYVAQAATAGNGNYIACSVTNTLIISPLTVTLTNSAGGIMLYGTNDTLTATTNSVGSTVYIYINNQQVASGITTATYNAINWQTAGVFSVIANEVVQQTSSTTYPSSKLAVVNPPIQIAHWLAFNTTGIQPLMPYTQNIVANSQSLALLGNSKFNNMVFFLANAMQLKSVLLGGNTLSSTSTVYNVSVPSSANGLLNTSILFLGYAYTNVITYSNPAFTANFTQNSLALAANNALAYTTNPPYNVMPPTFTTGNIPTLYGAYNPLRSWLPSIYYNESFTAYYANGTKDTQFSSPYHLYTNANILGLGTLKLIMNNTHTYQTNTLTNFGVYPVLLYGNGNTLLPSSYTNVVTAYTTQNGVTGLQLLFVNLSSNNYITGNVANSITAMAGYMNLTANNTASQYYKQQLVNGTQLGFTNYKTSFNANDVYQIDKFCANTYSNQNLQVASGLLQYESIANVISYFTFTGTNIGCSIPAINETLYIITNSSNLAQVNFYVQQGVTQVAANLQVYYYNINNNKYELLDYITSPSQGTSVTITIPNNKPYVINVYAPTTNKLLSTISTSLSCASGSICTYPLVITNSSTSPFKSVSNIIYNCNYNAGTKVLTCSATDPTSTAQGYQLFVTTQGSVSSFTACNTTSTGSYGVLTCSNINPTSEYVLYVNYPFIKYQLTSGTISSSSSAMPYGTTGYIAAFIVLLVLTFMSLYNPQLVIIIEIFGVIITGLLQLWYVAIPYLVELIVIGVIYVYKLRQ